MAAHPFEVGNAGRPGVVPRRDDDGTHAEGVQVGLDQGFAVAAVGGATLRGVDRSDLMHQPPRASVP